MVGVEAYEEERFVIMQAQDRRAAELMGLGAAHLYAAESSELVGPTRDCGVLDVSQTPFSAVASGGEVYLRRYSADLCAGDPFDVFDARPEDVQRGGFGDPDKLKSQVDAGSWVGCRLVMRDSTSAVVETLTLWLVNDFLDWYVSPATEPYELIQIYTIPLEPRSGSEVYCQIRDLAGASALRFRGLVDSGGLVS